MRMRRTYRRLAVLGAALLMPLVGMAGPAEASHVACGDTIPANTTTTLDSDVGPCSGHGIIMSDGAILDLNGHRVFGPTVAGGGDEAGILFDNVQNAKVTDSSATNVGGTWLSTNAVTLFDAGIAMVNGSSGNTVERVNVVGNVGVDGDFGEGIHVRNSDDNTLSGNNVSGNGPYGAVTFIDDSDGNDLVGSAIAGNVVTHQDIAVRLEVSFLPAAGCPDNNVIDGNKIVGNALDGVSILNGPACDSTGNQITDNQISGHARDGIRLNARLFGGINCYGAEATEVHGNNTSGNGGSGIKATSCVQNSDISGNTSLGNNPAVPPVAPVSPLAPPHGDLHDGNVNCGSNSWSSNTHVTEYAAPGSATAALNPLDYLCIN